MDIRSKMKEGRGMEFREKAKERLDRELESMIGDSGIGVPGLGAIVYKDGKEIYSRFLGHRTLAGDGSAERPMARDSRFRIASVSKPFTVFTLLQLMEQGKLDLDADIGDYLGFRLRNPHFPDVPITSRMLASHTSSLRDGKVYCISPERSVAEFFSPEGDYWEDGAHFAPPGQAPGAYFSYCNLNYGLLGTIIEAVTGERFDLYQKAHILRQLDTHADYVPGNFSREEFEKLGTIYQKKDATGNWNENGPWHGKADDYGGIQPPRDTVFLQNPYAEEVREACRLDDYRPGRNATPFSPAGGLRISCEELSHALEMWMNDGNYRGEQVLSPDSVRLMASSQWTYDPARRNGSDYGGSILSYGLGAYRMAGASSARLCRDREIDFVGHTGEAFGTISILCFRPGTKDGFLYVMNGTAMDVESDERSKGRFSSNTIWEERVADAICRFAFF